MTETSVVFLLWAPDESGVGDLAGHLDAFADAWTAHPPGMAHRLTVVCHNLPREAVEPVLGSGLARLGADLRVYPGQVADLAAYRLAATELPGDVCFLNSYSRPRVDGWLELLDRHLRAPGGGMVGATGSWESLSTIISRSRVPIVGPWLRTRLWGVRHRRPARRVLAQFPRFPAVHLRTNALLVRRDVLDGLAWDPLDSKLDALELESGRRSLTNQAIAAGVVPRVAGADGRAHAPEDWPASGTFRSGEQEHLLVEDNRTREYAEAAPARRHDLERRAWGAGASGGRVGV